ARCLPVGGDLPSSARAPGCDGRSAQAGATPIGFYSIACRPEAKLRHPDCRPQRWGVAAIPDVANAPGVGADRGGEAASAPRRLELGDSLPQRRPRSSKTVTGAVDG